MSGHYYYGTPALQQYPFRQPKIEDGIEYIMNNMANPLAMGGSNGIYDRPWYNDEEQRQAIYQQNPTGYFPHRDPARRAMVSPYKSPRQSICKLPIEVWMIIAKWCIPALDEQDEIPLGNCKAPLQLAQVSGGLRQLVQHMPELWKTICILPNHRRRLPDLRLVRKWLDFAGNRPLTVLLCETDKGQPAPPPGLQEVINELTNLVARWETAILWVPWTINTKWPRHNDNPSRLRALTIQGYTEYKQLSWFVTVLAEHASSLSCLTWEDHFGAETRYDGGFMTKLPLKFGNLTKLTLQNPVLVSEALTIFSISPLLVEVTMENLRMLSRNFTFPPQPICLPQLRSLKTIVDFESFEDREMSATLGPLLAHFYAPALRHAHFGYDERWSHAAFDRFIRMSNCRLSSLQFNVIALSEEDLRNTLRLTTAMGSLQTFTLKNGMEMKTPLTPTIIKKLTPSSREPYYLPTLQKLTVNVLALGKKRGGGAFGAMVKKRCTVQPRFLREVHLADVNDFSHPDVWEIRNLGNQGRILVTYDE